MKDVLYPLLLQIILIALNALFASAEIAFLSVNELKISQLSQKGNKKAKRLEKLTSKPTKFLATIQVAITLAGFFGSAFAAENFSDKLVALIKRTSLNIPLTDKTLDTIAVVLITVILSFFTLLFGELLPKRIAMKKADKIAIALCTPVAFISALFAPLVWLLTVCTNGLLRLFGINPNEEEEKVTEEEILLMVDAGSEEEIGRAHV